MLLLWLTVLSTLGPSLAFPTLKHLLKRNGMTEGFPVGFPICHMALQQLSMNPPADGSIGFIPQCEEDGSFKRVQCFDDSTPMAGWCYCVNTATGQPLADTYSQSTPDCSSKKRSTDNAMSEEIKRHVMQARQAGGNCGKEAETFTDAIMDMEKKIQDMYPIIQAIGQSVGMSDQIPPIETIESTDRETVHAVACFISNLRSLDDLAALMPPQEAAQLRQFYPIIKMLTPEVIGVLGDLVTALEALEDMGFFNLKNSY